MIYSYTSASESSIIVIKETIHLLMGTDAKTHSQILAGVWGNPQKRGESTIRAEGSRTPQEHDP